MSQDEALPVAPLPKPYYDQDGITIYHGDAMQYVRSLPEVDAVVTDPPYGIINKFGESTYAVGQSKGSVCRRRMQFAFDQPENVMEQVAAIVDAVASKAKA